MPKSLIIAWPSCSKPEFAVGILYREVQVISVPKYPEALEWVTAEKDSKVIIPESFESYKKVMLRECDVSLHWMIPLPNV